MRELKDQEPRIIGPYEITGYIGGGGMGQVYLGRSPGGYAVAVKVVRPELAADEAFRDRFAAEVEAARQVSGVYTAAVVDADVRADTPWMATEYVPGSPLDDVVTRPVGKSKVLRPNDVLVLAAGLAEALQAIHRAGLVHRDLKPGNVILTENGPRVLDFGIAKALEGATLTAAHTVIGTPAFMAPEQLLGRAVPASDVFSLGVTLAYAATGRIVVVPGRPAAVGAQIAAHQLDLTVLDGLPDLLRTLIADCLVKDPQDRPTPAQVLERATRRASYDRSVEGAWHADLTETIRRSTVTVVASNSDVAPTRKLPRQRMGGVTVPSDQPGRPPSLFWLHFTFWGICTTYFASAAAVWLIDETYGVPEWVVALRWGVAIGPGVGLLVGLVVRGVARSRWRALPWTSVTFDEDALTITGHNQPSRNTYSIAWGRIKQIGISDDETASWVIILFVNGTFRTNTQAEAWADQRGSWKLMPHRRSRFGLCKPAEGADRAEAERILAAVRQAMSSYAGSRFVDLDQQGRLRQDLG